MREAATSRPVNIMTVKIMNQTLKDEILMREMLDDDGPLGTDSAPDDATVDAALRAVRSKLARTLGRARRPLARVGVSIRRSGAYWWPKADAVCSRCSSSTCPMHPMRSPR